jgi:hypothetical protein
MTASRQPLLRNAPQVALDQWNKLLECARIALTPGLEQSRDVVLRGVVHSQLRDRAYQK